MKERTINRTTIQLSHTTHEYAKESKSVFITALFTITKICNQPKFISAINR